MEHIPLRIGSSGPVVRQVQRVLNAMGHPLGKIDGKFGPRTLRAVMAFQSANELPIDGVVATNTWIAMERKREGAQGEAEQASNMPAPGGKPPAEKKKIPLHTAPLIPWAPDPAEEGKDEGDENAKPPMEPRKDRTKARIPPLLSEEMPAKEPITAPLIVPQNLMAWAETDAEESAPWRESVTAVTEESAPWKPLGAESSLPQPETVAEKQPRYETVEVEAVENPWRRVDAEAESASPAKDLGPGPQLGDRGEKVADLQRKLKEMGQYDGEVTGFLGEGTARSMEAWRRESDPSASGYFGEV